MIRVAIAGAGAMARRRAHALLATGDAEICGVAAAHAASARACAADLGCPFFTDDVRALRDAEPDAMLVEVPNAAQDDIVMWAIGERLPVLIGGPLSASLVGGRRIMQAATAAGVPVEAGFEARYKPAWIAARRTVRDGSIGRVIAIRTVALWACDPGTWYAREGMTGGMPIAHMTYAFIDPLRWMFGDPTHVSAFANRVANVAAGAVVEETCVANLRFPDSVICTMTAGFVKPLEPETWSVWVIATDGALELLPTEMDAGALILHRGDRAVRQGFAAHEDAFVAQARAFLQAVLGQDTLRCRPSDVIGDLRVADAIVRSVRSSATVRLRGARAAAAPAARRTRDDRRRPVPSVGASGR